MAVCGDATRNASWLADLRLTNSYHPYILYSCQYLVDSAN